MKTTARRILLVEDDSKSADSSQILFEFWGYDVTVAHDASEATGTLAQSKLPDAIVLDLGLPSFQDGCTLLKQIRDMPRGEEILVLAVTGHAREVDRRLAIRAGCDFFFVKPADLDEVRGALRTIDGHSRRVARAHAK